MLASLPHNVALVGLFSDPGWPRRELEVAWASAHFLQESALNTEHAPGLVQWLENRPSSLFFSLLLFLTSSMIPKGRRHGPCPQGAYSLKRETDIATRC